MNPDIASLVGLANAPAGPAEQKLPSTLETALVDYQELSRLDLPEPRKHLAWLREGTLTMAYGIRGIGKTMFQLGLMGALVTGKPFLCWPVAAPVGVLVLDGEMPTEELQGRLTAMLPIPPMAPLYFLTGDMLYRRSEEDLRLSHEGTRADLLRLLDKNPDRMKHMDDGARGRDRTGTPLEGYGILSPGRLPIPPLGHRFLVAGLLHYRQERRNSSETLRDVLRPYTE